MSFFSRSNRFQNHVFLILTLVLFTGCGGASNPSDNDPSGPTGRNPASENNSPASNSFNSSSLTSLPGHSTCVSNDLNKQCLGIKMVSYLNSSTPVITESEAEILIQQMNQIWGNCKIAFQLESYQAINPNSKSGLSYDVDWQSDGDYVRETFSDDNRFLIVAVGSLSGSTIAVTRTPGAGPFGVLVEALYAKNAMTVGHELGHYMDLYHLSDNSNLMNPYIGSNTSGISSTQCATARDSNSNDWKDMLRY